MKTIDEKSYDEILESLDDNISLGLECLEKEKYCDLHRYFFADRFNGFAMTDELRLIMMNGEDNTGKEVFLDLVERSIQYAYQLSGGFSKNAFK